MSDFLVDEDMTSDAAASLRQRSHDAWTLWGMEPPHFGVLVFPQRYRLSGFEIADAVIALVESGQSLRNELFILGRDGDWTQPV